MDTKQIYIERSVHDRLKALCKERYMKIGGVATIAIREYLEREGRPMGEESARPVTQGSE